MYMSCFSESESGKRRAMERCYFVSLLYKYVIDHNAHILLFHVVSGKRRRIFGSLDNHFLLISGNSGE